MPAPWSGVAQCRIVGRLHGSECVNVFHLATNTVINDGNQLDLLLALATAMLACAIEKLLPAVTQDYTLVQVDAKLLHPTESDPVIATAPANSVGALGPVSASFIASLVNIRTGGGGRRGRGKKFLPPPGEAQSANSVMDNPTLVLLTEFLLCVAGKFTGAGATEAWRLGVMSFTRKKELGGTFDNSFREATQLSPTQTLAVMRSRKLGHGA